MKKKLCIGLYIDNEIVPIWIYRIIEKILHSESSEIKVVFNFNEISPINKQARSSLVYKLHEKLDHYVFKGNFDYDHPAKITDLLDGIPVIKIDSATNKTNRKAAIVNVHDEILTYKLDIILNFSLCQLQKIFSESAKYGVWSYNLGDDRAIKGFSNCYWEIIRNKLELGINIQISDDCKGKDKIIYRGWLAPCSNSLHVNRDQLFRLGSFVIPRILKGLYLYGHNYLETLISKYEKDIELFDHPVQKSPSSLKASINFMKVLIRTIYNKVFYLNSNKWFLMYLINDNTKRFHYAIGDFKVLYPPKDRFWADPFVVKEDNKFYIFVEELLYKKNIGRISVLTLDEQGKLLNTQIVLEKPYHLSYPFIFKWENTFYMIPETSGNKTIELYKCQHFPEKWQFITNVMENITAIDTTVLYHNSKWWLFTSIHESQNFINYDELSLFYSDDLFSGKWTPHPDNPIITDIKTARPAGKIFTYNNKIYRPSQDCSGRYGRAFNLNQIITLNEMEYAESLETKVEPNWNSSVKGTHTFNFDHNFTVIDAYSIRKRFKI